MDTDTSQTCKQCGGEAEGYKCAMCGEESAVYSESHECGDEHCMIKCAGCQEAEAKCTC